MEVLSISELLLSILQYTDMGTLMACFEVNKQFSNLCRHDTIWKELLEGDFDWQYQNLPPTIHIMLIWTRQCDITKK